MLGGFDVEDKRAFVPCVCADVDRSGSLVRDGAADRTERVLADVLVCDIFMTRLHVFLGRLPSVHGRQIGRSP